jgi:hypothetical protein
MRNIILAVSILSIGCGEPEPEPEPDCYETWLEVHQQESDNFVSTLSDSRLEAATAQDCPENPMCDAFIQELVLRDFIDSTCVD